MMAQRLEAPVQVPPETNFLIILTLPVNLFN